MKKQVFIFLLLISSNCFSQKENNIWMLGTQYPDNNCGLDFNNGTPDTFSVTRNLLIFLSNASICDTSGQLLFYTNGCRINNRNHDSLFNSNNFNPGWATDYYQPYGMGMPQNCFIIPRPSHNGQYYLFHESGEIVPVGGTTAAQPICLYYSLIDMTLDSGMGGIVQGQKNIHAFDDTLIYGRMTGVKHANGRDWWIVTHKSNTDIYDKLLVTPDTMMMTQQQIGRTHNYEKFAQQTVFNPQGNKYVMQLTADTNVVFGNVIDLFDFDRCSGMFSNEQHVIVPDTNLLALGCSFSPNGRYLYVSTNINIYQYDTWNVNINSTTTLVAQWDTFYSPLKTTFLFHQLAPDGKIYISTYQGTDVFHYINTPDQQGLACNVIQNSFFLPIPGNESMPNAPNYALGAEAGSVCDSLTGLTPLSNRQVPEVRCFPNPANEKFTISYDIPTNQKIKFSLIDVMGNTVLAKNLYGTFTYSVIDCKNLSGGIYFYQALVNNKLVDSGKIIINH